MEQIRNLLDFIRLSLYNTPWIQGGVLILLRTPSFVIKQLFI